MVWFRVDDILPFHERVLDAGNAAMGLWVRAGAWSSGHLTDGFIPTTIARQIGSAAEIRRLTMSGLWLPAEGGYQFHAWAEDGTGTPRQPTRASIETRRKVDRDRKAERTRKAAEARWNPDGDSEESAPIPDGIGAASHATRPVQSRPDPTNSTDEDPSSPTDGAEPAADGLQQRASRYGLDGERIRQALSQVLGEIPDDDTVMRVATTVLRKAPVVPDKPTAYIVGSIRKNEFETQETAWGAA